MNNENELAVIFKKSVFGNNIEYIPYKVVEGIYDEDNIAFIDKNGIPYWHLINGPENYGFCFRSEITNYCKIYPHLPISLIKRLLFETTKKSIYTESIDVNTGAPIIIAAKKKSHKEQIIIDYDSTMFYIMYHPDFLSKIANVSIEEINELCEEENNNENNSNIEKNTSQEDHKKIDINISSLYKSISNSVIGQEEPIKIILTAIWKQYNDFSDNKSRNILINGSTGVGKTEIFRILAKMIDIPCTIASATQYTASGYVGKSVEDMLISLLERANGNIERAKRGILIIDEIDKLAQTGKSSQVNQRDVQEALLKIVEDGIFTINWKNNDYEFDTSKLMVVAMGSWSRIELNEKRSVGFNSTAESKKYKDITSEDLIANGMIPELIGRFPIIIQMNELTYDSFIKILNTVKSSSLNQNIIFFKNHDIDLHLDREAIKLIALNASKSKFGVRGLDEEIEKVLSIASFEIASNPGIYKELIITPETVSDNKKYILIKK